MQVIGRQLDRECSDVLLQTGQLSGAWDGNNPRLLGEQPSERDLSRCRLLAFRNLVKQIHEGLIRFPVLWREARDDVAEIAFLQLRILADLSGQESFAKGTECNEFEPEFLQRRDPLRFRLSPPERVFA